ncbi:hypothetical protein TYRP_010443 [Tyrophagus putrescentiae]|nr:hypothetical protein TYRP_010443 [Tyrophagus putrescentiae]
MSAAVHYHLESAITMATASQLKSCKYPNHHHHHHCHLPLPVPLPYTVTASYYYVTPNSFAVQKKYFCSEKKG